MKPLARMAGQLILTVACLVAISFTVSSLMHAQADLVVDRINDSRPTVTVAQPVEDSPGWDCVRQGNLTCNIDGITMTSLHGIPGADMPFERCLYLLDIGRRIDPDSATYLDSVCNPIRRQLG